MLHSNAHVHGWAWPHQLYCTLLLALKSITHPDPLRSYVEQSDVMSTRTTVREALLFSARMRLDESITLDQARARGWARVGWVDSHRKERGVGMGRLESRRGPAQQLCSCAAPATLMLHLTPCLLS